MSIIELKDGVFIDLECIELVDYAPEDEEKPGRVHMQSGIIHEINKEFYDLLCVAIRKSSSAYKGD